MVKNEDVTALSEATENRFLPGTPHPAHTRPTTRYTTARTLPDNIRPADASIAEVEHSHLPLVAMLTLTQASVGGFLSLALTGNVSTPGAWEWSVALSSFVFGQLGMVAALFHLGRPQYAFRALLGLGHSWLSREILAFGIFSAAATTSTLWFIFSAGEYPFLGKALASGAALFGLLGVYTSAMVYHVTRRPSWRLRWTGGKFFMTTAVLGTALGFTSSALFDSPGWMAWSGAVIVTTLAKLHFEYRQLMLCPRGEEPPVDPEKRSVWLMRHTLHGLTSFRFVLGLSGGMILPASALLSPNSLTVMALGSLALLLAGEFTERLLFFKSMTAARMPGNPTS